MDLKNQTLTERDYKHYILHHYTFLSRPVIIINEEIFIGNSKAVVDAVKIATPVETCFFLKAGSKQNKNHQ